MTFSHGGYTMDQEEIDDQREENIVFLNRLLAAFVEDVLKEYAARQDADDQIINGIKDDILGIMKKHFDRGMSCTHDRDCGPGRQCNKSKGICVPLQRSFTWPFSDAR